MDFGNATQSGGRSGYNTGRTGSGGVGMIAHLRF